MRKRQNEDVVVFKREGRERGERGEREGRERGEIVERGKTKKMYF